MAGVAPSLLVSPMRSFGGDQHEKRFRLARLLLYEVNSPISQYVGRIIAGPRPYFLSPPSLLISYL
jgi:hypothetical protein